MSKSQDYIARVRFQNDLPPPLLPPKLLNYTGKPDESVRSSSLLSSLFRKENVNSVITLDNDLGMGLDIATIPTMFDEEKENGNGETVKLHAADRVFLRDPQVDRAIKNQPAVAFLRRTEYIGSNKSAANVTLSRSATPSASAKSEEDDSPASQLRAIEQTFESATKTLKDWKLLRHPMKKGLKAKKVWSLLPDVSRMDQKFGIVKFASSSLTDVSDVEYRTALYRKMRLDDVDWMSVYTADQESAKGIKRTLEDLAENVPTEIVDDAERYKYTKKSDFDVKVTDLSGEAQEIALRFDNEQGIVYYNPISHRADLKRRKIQETHRELLESADLDEINVRIREPTTAELNMRNTLRHKHDGVTYEATEFAEEEDEGEEEDDLDALRKSRETTTAGSE